MHLLRKLVTLGLFAALFLAHQASALGLGEITLKSALNQPLDAEIRLLNLRNLTADDIRIGLAAAEDFQRAGLERSNFYSELQFRVVTTGPGAPFVRVSTRAPVREPYLNFLVEARWSSGRLLREYTLLLDLPTFAEEAPAPVQAVRQEAPAAQPRAAAPRPAAQVQPQAAPAARTTSAPGNVYGPVTANDTLWEIALRVRPNNSVSVQQTMLALQRMNPDAFINGNINLLRRGQILQIPSLDEIRTLNNRQALSQVATQNREWAERTTGAQLDASRRAPAERRQPQEVSGQLTLATSSPAEATSAGRGTGEQQANAVAGQLSAAQEELEKSRRENTELRARLRDLEEQNQTMERLISVSNEQLRALQLAAEQGRSPEEPAPMVDEPAVPDVVEEPPVPTVDAETAAEPVEQAADAVVEAAPVEPAIAQPAPEPTRVVRSVPRQKTLMDHVQDNLLAIIGGLLVVLLGVWYFLRKRQADDGFEYEDSDDLSAPLAEDDESADFDEPGNAIDLADETLEPMDDLGEDFEDTSSAEAETGDVVSEADIYIAYGKLDQAEEMLLKGLSREPGSAPILLKLLEVYAEQQNLAAFDQHYAALQRAGDSAAVARAAELRTDIPGADEFDVGVQDDEPAAFAPPEGLDDDLTISLDEEPKSAGGDALDFDLDDDWQSSPAAPAAAADLADDDELSFGLDDDEEVDSEFTLSLEDDEPLVAEAGAVETGDARYDMSFEESEADADGDEDLSFDFSLDDEPAPSAPSAGEALASDDDFSFDLEDLDGEAEKPAEPSAALDSDFSFELDDLSEEPAGEANAEPVSPAEEALDFALDDDDADDFTLSLDEETPPSADLTLEDAGDDEFDPELTPGDVDLAALDEEMSALDADLAGLDEPEAAPAASDLSFELDEPEPAAAPADLDDELFEQALSGLTGDDAAGAEALSDKLADDLSDDDMDAELDFLADTDEAATKLDLARAYIDMGDSDGARDILSEVAEEGNEQQRQEAEQLLARIDS